MQTYTEILLCIVLTFLTVGVVAITSALAFVVWRFIRESLRD